MLILAFDRDGTVETGDPAGPVPIALIRGLAMFTDRRLIAIGNQKLVGEAGIDGLEGRWDWMPENARPTNDPAADILADPAKRSRNITAKHARLDWIRTFYAPASCFICVDDLDISYPGWIYLTPQQFMEAFGC